MTDGNNQTLIPGSEPDLLGGPTKPVQIPEYLASGWRLLWANPGLHIGYTVLILVVLYVLHWIPVLGNIAAALLSGPLTAGFYLALRKQVFGGNVAFGDYLLGFSKPVPLILVGLVSNLLIGLGMLLLILPGIYLAVSYLFAILLVADRDMDFWSAMETSRKFITRQWFVFFVLALLLVVANAVGAAIFGIGLLITIPFSLATVLSAYHDQIGLQQPAS